MSNPFGIAEHYTADLLGYSAQHEVRLLVEVKSGQNWLNSDLSAWDDEKWEQDFFPEVTGTLFPSPSTTDALPTTWWYYMLATAHQLALWLPGKTQFRTPDYLVEAAGCLDIAIDTQRIPLAQLNHDALQRVVSAWLFLSIFTPQEQVRQQAANRWLVDSGLHTALYRGEIVEPTTDRAPIYASVR